MERKKTEISYLFKNIPALLLIISGGLFALNYLLFDPLPYQIIESSTFLDRIIIPFDFVQIGPISFPINVDNYLIFQEFQAFPNSPQILEAYIFFGIVFLVSVSFLAILTEFKKLAVVAGGIGWIVLITLCNLNGLNIGGANANIPLIIVLIGTLGPVITIHIWGQNLSFILKWISVFLSFGISIFLLSKLSPIDNPIIYISEYSTILALGLSIAWIFWNGHSLVSGSYILLARINKNVGIKISRQIAVISLGYLTALFILFMEMTGDLANPFFGFSPLLLLIPTGVLGWFSLDSKIAQIPNLATSGRNLRILHLLGFGLVLWLCWKLIITGNQPGEEFLKHLFLYSQIGFTLFFIVYLFSNFLSIMNSGKEIDKILYKPYSLPYYHLRIGGLMAILVLTIYAEGIIGVQLNSLTNNILGDYYYQTDQKLEASILYENSWAKYRKNHKAKHLTAQLLFELNQPTLAKQHLEESFAEYPQVDNIILLSNRLHREDKIFESIFYLEKGLNVFPDEPHLTNNLALFYIKVNKPNEALRLLEDGNQNHKILTSNLQAIQTKLGVKGDKNDEPEDLIGQINLLVHNNTLANVSSEELKKEIKSSLQKTRSPMLIHAGWRSFYSEKNNSDPTADLQFLDSLSKDPIMSDYIMDIQETAVIRSLGAGRVIEAVKNLNGLAFRNPNSAGYYLSLTSQILAQNLDFKKSAKELLVAEEKGFQAFQPHHLAILLLAGFDEKMEEIREKYQVISPSYLRDPENTINRYLQLITNFHESFPQDLFLSWDKFPDSELKTDLSLRLLSYKSHDLNKSQMEMLGNYVKTKINTDENLDSFLADPNWENENSLNAFANWLKIGNDLTANPYFTPLVLTAAERIEDPLNQYELLNEMSQFNHDPLLWFKKIQAAKNLKLDNYANDALIEMSKWVPESELEKFNY
ncbi:hypothetical protein [Algoriphagus sp.]|uniref:hypothetical protein n=1 Tax=Algoriphagus sp. TaxID=1872435 RepID=UPI0025E2BACC|nr:hypothetical protein [Algoriphagus sp.]